MPVHRRGPWTGEAGPAQTEVPRRAPVPVMPKDGATALSAVPAVAGRNGWQVTGARQAARVPAEQAASAEAVPPEAADSAALPGVAEVAVVVAGSRYILFLVTGMDTEDTT